MATNAASEASAGEVMARGEGRWLFARFMDQSTALVLAAEWARKHKRGGEILDHNLNVIMRFELRGGPFHSVCFVECERRSAMSPAEALDEAADRLEHQAEFNMTETDRWPAERRAANYRLINQSRALRDRADAARRQA